MVPKISGVNYERRDFIIYKKSRILDFILGALVNKNWTQILLFSSVNIRLPYNAMLLLFLS